ncbi:hypothetical protein BDK51DRAFT_26067 [Blyttiomyces helicus]|uniref:Uncharacterized protein n=1 Tax=Blyttiomyces helicus TaxID=388810 RepID=A0A4P9WKR1_9FUNG|nr:hypothetical protein BDK51DRAFT_26067 [Blyttiomyces helicus]|eukprot:RKO92613.1 hypothetical protein BDK51DRAFT_26067 [Blyttiomyces helicus]
MPPPQPSATPMLPVELPFLLLLYCVPEGLRANHYQDVRHVIEGRTDGSVKTQQQRRFKMDDFFSLQTWASLACAEKIARTALFENGTLSPNRAKQPRRKFQLTKLIILKDSAFAPRGIFQRHAKGVPARNLRELRGLISDINPQFILSINRNTSIAPLSSAVAISNLTVPALNSISIEIEDYDKGFPGGRF